MHWPDGRGNHSAFIRQGEEACWRGTRRSEAIVDLFVYVRRGSGTWRQHRHIVSCRTLAPPTSEASRAVSGLTCSWTEIRSRANQNLSARATSRKTTIGSGVNLCGVIYICKFFDDLCYSLGIFMPRPFFYIYHCMKGCILQTL